MMIQRWWWWCPERRVAFLLLYWYSSFARFTTSSFSRPKSSLSRALSSAFDISLHYRRFCFNLPLRKRNFFLVLLFRLLLVEKSHRIASRRLYNSVKSYLKFLGLFFACCSHSQTHWQTRVSRKHKQPPTSGFLSYYLLSCALSAPRVYAEQHDIHHICRVQIYVTRAFSDASPCLYVSDLISFFRYFLSPPRKNIRVVLMTENCWMLHRQWPMMIFP